MLHEICIQWAHQAQKFNSSKAGRKNSSQKSTNSLDIPSLSPLRLRQLFNFRVLNIRYLLKSAPPPTPNVVSSSTGGTWTPLFPDEIGSDVSPTSTWLQTMRASRFMWNRRELILSNMSNHNSGWSRGCKLTSKNWAKNCVAPEISAAIYI